MATSGSAKRSWTGIRSSPVTGSAQRRHVPAQGARTVPWTSMPPLKEISSASISASAPAGTTLRPSSMPCSCIGPAWATSPRRISWACSPLRRRSRPTWTTKGSAVVTRNTSPPSRLILIEEAVAFLFAGGDALVGRGLHGGSGQPRPARLDGAGEAVEDDLHARQLLVDEVLGLVAQGAGLFVGVIEDALGHGVGLPDDLGALHHVLSLGADLVHQRLGLAAALSHELLALAEQP